MANINLPLPEWLLVAVDSEREDVPRTVWIRRAIEERLTREAGNRNQEEGPHGS